MAEAHLYKKEAVSLFSKLVADFGEIIRNEVFEDGAGGSGLLRQIGSMIKVVDGISSKKKKEIIEVSQIEERGVKDKKEIDMAIVMAILYVFGLIGRKGEEFFGIMIVPHETLNLFIKTGRKISFEVNETLIASAVVMENAEQRRDLVEFFIGMKDKREELVRCYIEGAKGLFIDSRL